LRFGGFWSPDPPCGRSGVATITRTRRPLVFFWGGGYCSPGKYVYVHAVAMYILLSDDNVLIQMNWREMAICLIQLI
ncbi:hypothetical protein ABG885_08435, partial [Bifidobacterium longum]